MSTNKDPDLTIVTVTFDSKHVINRCLDSLAATGYLPNSRVEIIVVDRCSADGTAQAVAAAYPTVTVVPLAENVGFARGCNVGLRRSASPFALLLNPDCVVHAGAIDALIAELNKHPKAAAVGPRLICESGTPQISSQRFPTLKQEFARQLAPISAKVDLEDVPADQPERSCAVDWIAGTCMLVRRDALEDVGLLDESFFLYYEGADWCKRARDAGWEVRHLPTVSITHIGGSDVAMSDQEALSGRSLALYVDSRRNYFRKHYGVHAVLAIEAMRASSQLVRAAKSAFGRSVEAWR